MTKKLPAKDPRVDPRSKFTAAVEEKIVHAVKHGATYELAALYAGVERTTVWRWIERGEAEEEGPYHDFAIKIHEAEGTAAVECLAVIKGASSAQWQAAAWLLERRYPMTFGRSEARVVHEMGGIGGGPIKHVHAHLDMNKILADPDAMEAYARLEGKIQRALPADADESGSESGRAR